MRWLHLLLTMVVVCSCTMGPPEKNIATRRSAPPPLSHSTLVAGDWRQTLPTATWRQSALFIWRNHTLPMVGILRWQPQTNTLQLLALDQLGTKLFLYQIDHSGDELRVFQPALENFAGLKELLGSLLHRLFTTGPIPMEFRGEQRQDNWLISSTEGESTWFQFRASDLMLTAWGEKDWRVDCYELKNHNGLIWPAKMVLTDKKHRSRLILRNEELTIDER